MSILITRHTKSTWLYHIGMMVAFETMNMKWTPTMANESKKTKAMTIKRAHELSELLNLYSSGV